MFTVQVTGVGYSASGCVTCNGEIVRNNTHPSICKVIEVQILMLVDGTIAGRPLGVLLDDVSKRCMPVLQVGVVCNNAQIVEGTLIGQPTEGALVVCAMKVTLVSESCAHFRTSTSLLERLCCACLSMI